MVPKSDQIRMTLFHQDSHTKSLLLNYVTGTSTGKQTSAGGFAWLIHGCGHRLKARAHRDEYHLHFHGDEDVNLDVTLYRKSFFLYIMLTCVLSCC